MGSLCSIDTEDILCGDLLYLVSSAGLSIVDVAEGYSDDVRDAMLDRFPAR